jgi:hypothetical protein
MIILVLVIIKNQKDEFIKIINKLILNSTRVLLNITAIDVDDWSKLTDLLEDFKKERTIKIALDHEQKLKKLGIKKKSIINSTNITQRGKKTTNLITQDAQFLSRACMS